MHERQEKGKHMPKDKLIVRDDKRGERERERERDEQMKVPNVNEYYTVSHELVCVFKAIASTNKT